MFHGSLVALVTPMTRTGELDIPRLQALVDRHLAEGTNGIVVSGTTGEAPTLSKKDRETLIKTTLDRVKGKIPVIAGTGTYSTQETIQRTQEAYNLGVDACLVVTPYYNKPTQEGLFQHFSTVANAVSVPIILYNVASRTGCDLLPETVARLAKINNIVGLKEGGSDLARGRELLKACEANPIDFFSGDDASSLAFMLQGGKGVISVTANVAPQMMQQMCKAALEPNLRIAGEINTKLMPLHKALFVESNPIPVKWALEKLGWIEGGIRLPLLPLSEKNQAIVQNAMKESGIL